MSTVIYVKNKNTFAKNNYFAIKRMSKALGLFFKAHEFSDENIKNFTYNPNQFEWKAFDYPDAPRGLKELPMEDAKLRKIWSKPDQAVKASEKNPRSRRYPKNNHPKIKRRITHIRRECFKSMLPFYALAGSTSDER